MPLLFTGNANQLLTQFPGLSDVSASGAIVEGEPRGQLPGNFGGPRQQPPVIQPPVTPPPVPVPPPVTPPPLPSTGLDSLGSLRDLLFPTSSRLRTNPELSIGQNLTNLTESRRVIDSDYVASVLAPLFNSPSAPLFNSFSPQTIGRHFADRNINSTADILSLARFMLGPLGGAQLPVGDPLSASLQNKLRQFASSLVSSNPNFTLKLDPGPPNITPPVVQQ